MQWWRKDNVFTTSTRRRVDVVKTLLSRPVPAGMSPIRNIPALPQVMAWRRTGAKPLPEPMVTQFTDAYMWHYEEGIS